MMPKAVSCEHAGALGMIELPRPSAAYGMNQPLLDEPYDTAIACATDATGARSFSAPWATSSPQEVMCEPWRALGQIAM